LHPFAALLAALGLAAGALSSVFAAPADDPIDSSGQHRSGPDTSEPEAKPKLDRSGRRRIGKASVYARTLGGHTMADGMPMQLNGNNAASKTLPLGTTAKVTNLQTGRSAVVTIRDRGPFVPGRILDLSPSTADAIGLDKTKGVAPVAVAPIAVPLPNGETKPGVAAIASSTKDKSERVARNRER
jgi:rare lipoprotein A